MWVDGKLIATKRTAVAHMKYDPSKAKLYIGTYKDSNKEFNLVGEIHSAFSYNYPISDADIVRR